MSRQLKRPVLLPLLLLPSLRRTRQGLDRPSRRFDPTVCRIAVTLCLAGCFWFAMAEQPRAESPIATVSATSTDAHAPESSSQNFVVTTSVRTEGGEVQSFRTLFREGIAVQLTGDGSRFITIYDDHDVTMLDRMLGVRCKLSHRQLIDITDRAAEVVRGSVRAAEMGVDVHPKTDGDRYAAEFGPFRYRVDTRSGSFPTMAADYAKSANAAVRLNLVRGGGVPPFARLAINRVMTRDNRLPSRTELTIDRGDGRPQVFTSENTFQPFGEADNERFDSALAMRSLYQKIPIDQFEPL